MKKFKSILFWLISFTWGLPLTLFGTVVALGCLITGHKPHRFYQHIYFSFGVGGWGFEAGPFFFVSKDSENDLKLKQHESGHGIQNLIFGPLMPIIVCIPSCIRFWYREWLVKYKGKRYSDLPPYDSIWFEGWATQLGQKYYK